MVQSEAQKRAKAKYYQILKENPEYREASAKRTKEYYTNNKEKHMETCKLYYTENKEKLLQYSKDKRKENKIKSVVSKLENISVEDLAKLLIEARKTKLGKPRGRYARVAFELTLRILGLATLPGPLPSGANH